MGARLSLGLVDGAEAEKLARLVLQNAYGADKQQEVRAALSSGVCACGV